MAIIIGILIIVILGKLIFSPSIDNTEEGKIFLYFWWGSKRKCIELWQKYY